MTKERKLYLEMRWHMQNEWRRHESNPAKRLKPEQLEAMNKKLGAPTFHQAIRSAVNQVVDDLERR